MLINLTSSELVIKRADEIIATLPAGPKCAIPQRRIRNVLGQIKIDADQPDNENNLVTINSMQTTDVVLINSVGSVEAVEDFPEFFAGTIYVVEEEVARYLRRQDVVYAVQTDTDTNFYSISIM